MNSENPFPSQSDPDCSRNADSRVDPRTIFNEVLKEVKRRASCGDVKELDRPAIKVSMTDAQKAGYLNAILEEMQFRDLEVLSPSVLFSAADAALGGRISPTRARAGILPGTMNPVHYGHLSASLAAILAHDLNTVLLAGGGTLPDKPYSANFAQRNEMLTIAVNDLDLRDWLQVTSIRQQTAEMFLEDERTMLVAGGDEITRRSNMDLAALIWLFRANPYVTWFYLVGSDKVAGYGRKGEYSLVVETLGDARANARVVYYARPDETIDVAKDIAPYAWMLEKWQTGFFAKSPLAACDISSSEIRSALVEGRDAVDGIALTKCLPRNVFTYAQNSKVLLASYTREIEARRGATEAILPADTDHVGD